MSINLMSAIFRTEFRDLQDAEGNNTKASTAKFVCLALADHANDEGEGAYPSINRLAYKTSLSRSAVINALDAMKHNGILTANGTSKWDTVNYTVNPICFSQGSQPTILVNPIDPPQSTQLTPPVNPVDPNHPLTVLEPSFGVPPLKTDELPIEWQIAVGVDKVVIPDQTDARRWDVAQLIGMGEKSVAIELAYAFMKARDILIPESKIKGQRKAVREMIEMGVQPEHVTEAVRQLLAKNMTVIDLFSVSKTAQDLANKKEVYTGERQSHAL